MILWENMDFTERPLTLLQKSDRDKEFSNALLKVSISAFGTAVAFSYFVSLYKKFKMGCSKAEAQGIETSDCLTSELLGWGSLGIILIYCHYTAGLKETLGRHLRPD